MTTTALPSDEFDRLTPAIEAVSRRADFVACLVGHALDAICEQAGIEAKSATACPISAGFLLELGAVLQLWLWERAGLNVHLEAGLPSSEDAGKELEIRARSNLSEFDDVARLLLWRKVNTLWIERFAWDGQHLLGAEIIVDHSDEELVEQLANFLWRNRGVLSELQ